MNVENFMRLLAGGDDDTEPELSQSTTAILMRQLGLL